MRKSAFLLLLMMSLPAMADDIQLTVSMLGAPWVVPVAPTASYVRTLRVVANKKISVTMVVSVPFLGNVTGEEIPITFQPEALELEPNIPQLVRLTFTKASHAELYGGVVEFRLKSPVRKIVEASLQLDARMRPELIAPALKTFSRVQNSSLGDGLTKMLLGNAATDPKVEVRVQSSKPQRIQLRGKDAVVVGEKTGLEVGCRITESSCEGKSGELGVVRVALTIDRQNLPPDKYSGAVLLLSNEPDATAVSVPIEIAIRAAPFLPLLAIILGIVLGVVVKWMDEKGNRQAELLIRLDRAATALQSQDRVAVQDLLDKARQQIYLADIANAETTVSDIEKRAAALRQIDRWKEELAGTTAPELLAELEMMRASSLLSPPEEQKLIDLGAKVQEALAKASQNRSLDNGAKGSTSPRHSIAARFASLQDAFRRWRAESAPLIRVALYLLTVIGLIYAGITTLYVSNTTFGANGIGDYVALILWGVGADVAGKTLSGLGSLLNR